MRSRKRKEKAKEKEREKKLLIGKTKSFGEIGADNNLFIAAFYHANVSSWIHAPILSSSIVCHTFCDSSFSLSVFCLSIRTFLVYLDKSKINFEG